MTPLHSCAYFVLASLFTATSVFAVPQIELFAPVNGVFPAANVGLVQNGTDAVSGVAHINLSNTLSVLDFAICDGVSNASTGINAAITAASTAGKAVYFPAGVCSISSPITAASGVKLYGDGNSSIIRLSASAASDYMVQGTGSGTLNGMQIESLRFENLHVSASSPQAALNFDGQNYTNLTVKNTTYYSATAGSNYLLLKSNTGKTARNIVIKDNVIEQCGRIGFEIYNGNATYDLSEITISNNVIKSCAMMGISIAGTIENVSIGDNQITGVGTSYGIELVGVRSAVVANNIFAGSFGNMISTSASSTGSISSGLVYSGNTTNNRIMGAVFLSAAGDVVLTGNRFTITGAVTLSGAATSGALVSGNMIDSAATSALICDNSPNHVIRGNRITNLNAATGYAAVRAYNTGATGIVLQGNVIDPKLTTASYDAQAGGAYKLVSDNIFAGVYSQSVVP